MLGCNEVDVVYPAHVLQLHVPLGELLRCEVKAVALVGDVVVLQSQPQFTSTCGVNPLT
jgi:hypothetical protein